MHLEMGAIAGQAAADALRPQYASACGKMLRLPTP